MIKGFLEIPLLDMIEQIGEEEVRRILSDFSCPQNLDVEYFLKHRAIDFAKQSITQTQLIFLQYKGELRLAAYYSLTTKIITVKDSAISSTLRKKLRKFGTRDSTTKGYNIPAPLIAQLGKNFTDNLNKQITGDELLKMALNKISIVLFILGGKAVYLECEDIPSLVEFYTRNGFVRFGSRPKDSEEADRIKGEVLLQLLKIIK